MDFVHLIWAALSDPIVVAAAYTGGILLLADVLTGALKAYRSGSFQWVWLDAFVKTKVAGKYLPLLLLYIVAKATPDLPVADGVNPLATLASLGFAAFLASEIASIKSNVDSSIDTAPQGVTVPEVSTSYVLNSSTFTPVADEGVPPTLNTRGPDDGAALG